MSNPRPFRHLFAALLGAALSTTAAVPPPEQLFPADTLGLFAVPDCAKVAEAQKTSPMLKLWEDESFRPFRDKFLTKLKQQVIEPLETQLGVKLGDYAGLVRGQFSMGITRNGWNGTADPLPGFLVVIDSRDQAEQLAKSLAEARKKFADAGQPLKTEKLREVEFSTIPIEPADGPKFGLSFGQSGSVLLLGTNPKDLEQLLGRLAGAGGQPLAEVPAFDRNFQATFRDALAYGWINFTPVYDVIGKVASAATAGREGPDPTKMLGAIGLGSLKSFAFASRVGPDGPTADLVITTPETERRGLTRLIATEAKDAAPPAFVPADVLSFSRWRLNGQKAWATLEGTVNEVSGGAIQSFFIAPIAELGKKKDPNFDLQKSLIANLGDDLISYQKAPRGTTLEALTSAPSISLIGSPNAEQLLQSIRTLVGALGETPMIPGLGNVQFKEREFLGRKIYSVPLPGEAAPGGEKALHCCASGDYLALSMDSGIIEEYLRSAETKPKPLAATPGLAAAAQKVGGMSTGLFAYQNDRENARVIFDLINANQDFLGQLFAASPLGEAIKSEDRSKALKEWLDFSLLPPFEKLAKYFSFTITAGKMNADGYVLKVFTPNPTGTN